MYKCVAPIIASNGIEYSVGSEISDYELAGLLESEQNRFVKSADDFWGEDYDDFDLDPNEEYKNLTP